MNYAGHGAVVSSPGQPSKAARIGPLTWAADTTAHWRREVLLPFFNQYLKTDSAVAQTPPVFIYDTGADHWDRPKAFRRAASPAVQWRRSRCTCAPGEGCRLSLRRPKRKQRSLTSMLAIR